MSDTTAPVLHSINLDSTSVNIDTGETTLLVTAHFSDGGTGMSGLAFIRFVSPSGQFVDGIFDVEHPVSGGRLDGFYQASVTLPAGAEAGQWQAEWMVLTDAAGNMTDLSPTNSMSLAGTSFTVVNGGADTTAPVLHSISLDDTSVNIDTGETTLLVTAHFSDGGTGMSGLAFIRFVSPSGQFVDGIFDVEHPVSGGRLDGFYQASVTLPAGAEAGQWQAEWMVLTDAAGNMTDLSPTNSMSLAGTSFTVVNGGSGNGDTNEDPSGTDNTLAVPENGSHAFSAGDFGFMDLDGDNLSAVIITTLPLVGSLTFRGYAVIAGQTIVAADIGQLVWTPPAANASGSALASFTFQVVDDGGTANGGQDTDQSSNTITIAVTNANAIVGTPGNDLLVGTAVADTIDGLGGDDDVQGLGGADILTGGAGNDALYGGDGNDKLYGGEGADTLEGGYGADTLQGGAGDDTLTDIGTDAQWTWMYGGAGNDRLTVTSGNSALIGEEGNDALIGGEGFDQLDGGSGLDTLTGGADNDILYGGDDSDNLDGGEGSDQLIGGSGLDMLTGGAGVDQFEGSASDLNGDRITDYQYGEKIYLYTDQGLLSAGNVRLAAAGADTQLQIDADNNGSFETVLTLAGTVSGNILLTSDDDFINANVIRIIAAPGGGGSVSLATPIADRSVAEDTHWSYQVPAGTFTSNGAGLTYTATLGDGSVLPDWITFDAATRTLSGTPPLNFNGSIDLAVVATNGAFTASDVFALAVTPVNDAPSAAVVTLPSSSEDTPVTITAAQLLAGAFDVDGTALTVTSLSLASGGGTPTNNSNGTWTYTPAANHNGPVSFNYTVTDGALSASSTASLSLVSSNDAPLATDDTAAVVEYATVSGSVLTNPGADQDADGDLLGVLQVSGASDWVGAPVAGRFGTLTLLANGSFSYVADNAETLAAGQSGVDVFTYTVSDGNGGTDTATLTISVSGTNSGTTGNDHLQGTDAAEAFFGGAGDDIIDAGAGNDILDGGAGFDFLNGGTGNDSYALGSEYDSVVDVSGTDTIISTISRSLANYAGVENLTLLGSGNVSGTGSALTNVITGNTGANVLNGAAGNDTLNGAGGNDVIYGGAGNDTLTGGAGNDYFVFNAALNASTNVDRITDFNVVQDTFRLENAVMKGLGTHLGKLSSSSFHKSKTGLAHDSNDHIIYETDTGWLNYDSNGSAAGGAVHIAHLNPNLALTYADFVVI